MPHRFSPRLVLALAASLFVTACSSPTTPPAPPPGPGPAPTNAPPAIASITVQGRRSGQPARFADLRETVDVAATVTDAETPIDELVYQWTATAGTFTGTGRNPTWTAPDGASTPVAVTITLKVVESYGHPGQPKNFSQEVTRTQTIALHDSLKEVGDMARSFLTEFSKPQTNQNVDDVMKDFSESRCPQANEVRDERDQVIAHYTNYVMVDYVIGQASVNLDFGGACDFRGALGDACAVVPVYWNSTEKSTGVTSSTSGLDHISAVYAADDSRWWLCSSQYEHLGSLTAAGFYSR
jgi:hypothetical protein